MLQRVLEQAGLATVSISLVREHTERIRPPRAVFVPFPFGMPFGRPGDAEQQHRVLATALETFAAPAGPVLVDVPDAEDTREVSAAPLQASEIEPTATTLDVATEAFTLRRHHEQWVEREQRTSVGLTGIPPVRFRGIVRFLEAVAAGEYVDMRERPADVSRALFVRLCADDLKAMYVEGRLATNPGEAPDAIARWLWSQTALGVLLRAVQERLEGSADPALREAAHGIAR